MKHHLLKILARRECADQGRLELFLLWAIQLHRVSALLRSLIAVLPYSSTKYTFSIDNSGRSCKKTVYQEDAKATPLQRDPARPTRSAMHSPCMKARTTRLAHDGQPQTTDASLAHAPAPAKDNVLHAILCFASHPDRPGNAAIISHQTHRHPSWPPCTSAATRWPQDIPLCPPAASQRHRWRSSGSALKAVEMQSGLCQYTICTVLPVIWIKS